MIIPKNNISLDLFTYIAYPEIGHSTVVFKKNKFPGYPEIGVRHDYAAWISSLAIGLKFGCISNVGALRFQTENSLSSLPKYKLLIKQFSIVRKYSGLRLYIIIWLFIKFITFHISKKFFCIK